MPRTPATKSRPTSFRPFRFFRRLRILRSRFVAVATLSAFASVGCATPPIPCDDLDARTYGSVDRAHRIWTVPPGSDPFALAETAQRCALQTHKPVALVEAESRRFLGIVQADREIGRYEGREHVLDDFLWKNTRRSRAKRDCDPSGLEDLKQSNGVEQIEVRRIVADVEDRLELGSQDFEFASRWLIRCLPTKEPLAWVTPDGRLIGVYLKRDFDWFK